MALLLWFEMYVVQIFHIAGVDCNGNEAAMENCQVNYTSVATAEDGDRGSSCQLETHAVSVTCLVDSLALCRGRDEVPWQGKCYSLYK